MATGVSIGASSYLAWGMQTAFRTPQDTRIAGSHRRSGSVFTSRQTQTPRESTTQIMPRGDTLWQRMGLVDFSAEFDYSPHNTAWIPLFLGAWGRRLNTAGTPDVDLYTMMNPYMDGGTDATPVNTTYMHGLTIQESLASGSSEQHNTIVQDISINQFQVTFEADAPVRMQFTGVGQKRANDASPTAFTEITGTTLAWPHLYATANSGIYVSTANPPATAMVCKRCVFTLDNNLAFEPQLGSASGEELRTPSRAGWPSAQFAFEMWFEDAPSGTDAVVLMTDFLANTKQNVRVEGFVDANNSMELLLGKTNDSGVIDDPKPVYSGPGAVGFTMNILAYPVSMTGAATDDLQMVITAA